MNITITGSLGNIGRPLTTQLVAKGHRVTLISHNPERAAAIEQLNAIPMIGSLDDPDLLLRAFENADAVFTMIPPGFHAPDVREYMRRMGEKYVRAIDQARVRYVVNLSSVGADLPAGPGPTGVNHEIEQRMDASGDVHVLHLRPGMFYTNFFGNIPMIRAQQLIGNNFDAGVGMLLTHPRDIAAAACLALDTLSFSGKNIQYIVGAETNGGEVAQALGGAIGKPELRWMHFSDEDLLQGLMQSGFTRDMASVYVVEIGVALREGRMLDHYRRNKDKSVGGTSLADFAREFAAVYSKL